ncbi:hypothetical protein [Algisphaera agarilytica]|uniref:Transmembrane protein n=1 Tax=Algisphaera agarilytica TaxID=1385975 RepID=A0A7X0H704_9BACT|nr:hypothetical protein [Algisphaera agarilytica]MBB6429291.1 hypothetical protein [Algisphaera agarilytica]
MAHSLTSLRRPLVATILALLLLAFAPSSGLASPSWVLSTTLTSKTEPADDRKDEDDDDDDDDSTFCIISSMSLIFTLGVSLYLTTRRRPHPELPLDSKRHVDRDAG